MGNGLTSASEGCVTHHRHSLGQVNGMSLGICASSGRWIQKWEESDKGLSQARETLLSREKGVWVERPGVSLCCRSQPWDVKPGAVA